MRIELTARAEQLAEAASVWWHENRQAAPTLFDRELLEALELLGEMPNIGVPYPPRPTCRRLLLRRSGYHVYYRVDNDNDVLYVVSIWHTRRSRGPRP